jgi:threonine/homoserine/homoserine lactone efflux protein
LAFQNLELFLISAIALNVTPGPDTLYVIGRSIGQGRMAGVVSVLGGSTGRILHTLFAAFGISAALFASPEAFKIIRLAGAIFLIYLAIRMFYTTAPAGESQNKKENLFAIYRQGVITNVLNPAVAIFFLSFLPQFTVPENGHMTLQLIVLGLIFTSTATLWSLILALFSGYAGNWLSGHPMFAARQRWITGIIFFALGIYFFATVIRSLS